MKQIPLSRGLFAIVDDEDFDFLSQWKWSALASSSPGKFYAVRTTGKKEGGKPRMILMHRVLVSAPLGSIVDHQDGNGLNNRRKNIRVCTHAQNMLNRVANRSLKTSHFKGVSRHTNGKWSVWFRERYVGQFPTEQQAAAAYDREATKYDAEFALTNRELEEA
jgi:hypothetical protein